MTRKEARENAFLLLFERGCNEGDDARELFDRAVEIRGLEVNEYVEKVYFGSLEENEAISSVIDENLVGWKKNRVSPISMALLRLATYEMTHFEDVPFKVAINEAVELSKKYDDEKAYLFVNGVLNAIAAALGKK